MPTPKKALPGLAGLPWGFPKPLPQEVLAEPQAGPELPTPCVAAAHSGSQAGFLSGELKLLRAGKFDFAFSVFTLWSFTPAFPVVTVQEASFCPPLQGRVPRP